MTLHSTPASKIQPLVSLTDELSTRAQGVRLILCQGDFEVLHPGYIHQLAQARELGEILVVAITPDRYVAKAPGHASYDERSRAEAVAALAMVDHVVIGVGPDGMIPIQLLHPAVFLPCGPTEAERRQEQCAEAEETRKYGGQWLLPALPDQLAQMPFTNPFSVYPPEVMQYLGDFASRYSAASVTQWLDAPRNLKVLVVGEAIIDEYHYCETLGKSGKEPILATRYLHSERFAGGILAVANNVCAFAEDVTLLTILGRQDGRPDPSEPFIQESLNPRVKPIFLYQDDAPTITKRRYVEQYPLQKLFEVYQLKHVEENSPVADAFCDELEARLDAFDVVIVTDYGHGMFVPRATEILCRRSHFLAVNTQANADNQGFNTISKYARADFVSLSEKELRLETRSKRRDTACLMEEVTKKLGCRSMLITRGNHGNLLFDSKLGFAASPTLSSKILDRVGAGDAVLSLASLCVAQGAPPEIVGFLGNIVGAHAVATVGHRQSLDRDRLAEHIAAILI